MSAKIEDKYSSREYPFNYYSGLTLIDSIVMFFI